MTPEAKDASAGAAADGATTAIGLASGFAEANPLGLLGSGAVKLAMIGVSQNADCPTRKKASNASTTVSIGAAAANIATIAGGPVTMAIALGILGGAGYQEYRKNNPLPPCYNGVPVGWDALSTANTPYIDRMDRAEGGWHYSRPTWMITKDAEI